MNISQSQFDSLVREVRSIKKMLRTSQQERWIGEERAMELTGLSKKSLQRKRTSGEIKKWRALQSGKKIQYSEHELQSLFTSTII